ncbi:MAG: D-alanine--D-alanine ligase family protein [Pirellulales bacterium]
MRIGLTFNVKTEIEVTSPGAGTPGSGAPCSGAVEVPDDLEEEFDSPKTLDALAAVFRSLGHEVEFLGDGEPALRRLLAGPRPDLVFNIAEGRGIGRSREARIPAVLEMLGIAYSGSDPLTLSVTLDKDCAKRLIRAAGVATPDWVLIDGDPRQSEDSLARLGLPLIVKPAYEGSSKGVRATSLLRSSEGLVDAVAKLQSLYRQPVLVEEFIDGDELTVGILGDGAPSVMGIMRVVPRQTSGPFIYSLEVKRDWQRLVRYECPALLSPEDTRAVEQSALAAWRALGCRDVSRVDLRLRNHVPYFLEVNPLPGLSPEYGDLVLMARFQGIDYPTLVSRILAAAIQRQTDARA